MAIQAFCQRAKEKMHNSCLTSSVGTEYKLLYQIPFPDYLQSNRNMTSSDELNACLWFISFVYRLRNALFHEIINPLDTSWQLLFKNAYLVLKQVVDSNIQRLKVISKLINEAQIIFEKDFKDEPPPDIPIKNDKNTTFLYKRHELINYNERGAKVNIHSTIICEGVSYNVKCNIKWNDKLQDPKVKNVQIEKKHHR